MKQIEISDKCRLREPLIAEIVDLLNEVVESIKEEKCIHKRGGRCECYEHPCSHCFSYK